MTRHFQKILNQLSILHYRITHSLFYWGVDVDGDLVFRLFYVLSFTKYKEHTLIKIGRSPIIRPADKYQGRS